MQKKHPIGTTLAASLAAALFGIAPVHAASGQAAPASPAAAAPAASDSAAVAATAPAAKLADADREVLADLAMANMAEIATANIALDKSANPDVKGYAQRMLDDHTKAQAEVQALAKAKGVELPTELNIKYKAKTAMLKALKGEIFNRTYIKQSGRADHRDTHGKLKAGLEDVKDPEVKALVTKIRPIVEQHLIMAEELIAKSGRTSMGTAGAPPK